MLLAADLRGRKIRTIEGLGSPSALSPLQESFWKHDASMCGFCTPGFVMAIQACMERNPGAGLAEIKEGCAGNACRCGTQPQVFAAALAAAPAFRTGAK
jgi:aerobic-type carbon monoxide dehydrogenase small subunit (CoxS/CutS family)